MLLFFIRANVLLYFCIINWFAGPSDKIFGRGRFWAPLKEEMMLNDRASKGQDEKKAEPVDLTGLPEKTKYDLKKFEQLARLPGAEGAKKIFYLNKNDYLPDGARRYGTISEYEEHNEFKDYDQDDIWGPSKIATLMKFLAPLRDNGCVFMLKGRWGLEEIVNFIKGSHETGSHFFGLCGCPIYSWEPSEIEKLIEALSEYKINALDLSSNDLDQCKEEQIIALVRGMATIEGGFYLNLSKNNLHRWPDERLGSFLAEIQKPLKLDLAANGFSAGQDLMVQSRLKEGATGLPEAKKIANQENSPQLVINGAPFFTGQAKPLANLNLSGGQLGLSENQLTNKPR